MNWLVLIAKAVFSILCGWIAKKRQQDKMQNLQSEVTHDAQVIADQQHTIEVGETRHEVEQSVATDSRQQLIDKLRNEDAIRQE